MEEDLLNSVIANKREKIIPQAPRESAYEPHSALFPILEIYDSSQQDPETNVRVKYIYDNLTDECGTARDKIMHILSELPVISDTPVIDRIYRYCRIKEDCSKALKRYEYLKERMRRI